MPADVTEYTGKITSEHNQAPNYMAMVTALVQPLADGLDAALELPGKFDVDLAVGQQLDFVGQWIGRTRYLSIPLVGVYFALDTIDVGLDEGTWKQPFDPVSGLTELPDDTYRTLLRTVIAANQWNGTIPDAYEIWSTIFAVTGSQIAIVDNGNMTMSIIIFGAALNAVIIALLTTGQIVLKPAGVRIVNYYVPSVPGSPVFGLDAEGEVIAGLDTGSWEVVLAG